MAAAARPFSKSTTLPMDIILMEILPRLPLKSLIKFKRVCKSLETLISSSKFYHRRHSLSPGSDDILILVRGNPHRRLLAVNDISSPESHAIELLLPQAFKRLSCHEIDKVVSCNGLLCILTTLVMSDCRFSLTSSPLFLLNPSTGIYRQISLSFVPVNVGFGFDSKADDYKIVAITTLRDNGRDVMVYSLKSNSWRLVERTLYPIDEVFTSGVVIDNHLFHCIFSSTSDVPKHRIRCFNLQTEQWENDLLLPSHYETDRQDVSTCSNLLINLGVLEGRLCLSVQYFHKRKMCCVTDAWIMMEYGVRDSWRKLLRVTRSPDPMPNVSTPASPSRDDVSIWQWDRLVWYDDIRDKKATMVEIRELSSSFLDACICSRSLVAIPGGIPIQIGEIL